MSTENKFSKKINVVKTTNILYFTGRAEGDTASSVRNDTANPAPLKKGGVILRMK